MLGSPAGTPTGAGRTPLRRWVLPACFFVIAVTLVLAGVLTRQDHSATATLPPPVSSPTSSEVPPQGDVDPIPISLTIESIGVSSDLVRLGLEQDRTVEVPDEADQAGWYELGVAPGQVGSAVILGHVDSTEGPAVFYRLDELTPGARITVELQDGQVETFEVSRIETVRNADFPATEVYGTKDRPTLTLVTCGGEYDKSRGGYQSNVIVYTEHVG